jgi:hypothetical protein
LQVIRIDKTYELHQDRIILDTEIDIDQLGWQAGDYFRVTNVNGQAMLVKVNPLIAFIRDGAAEINEQNNANR